MGSRKFDNLSALDWDDSALIKAYNKGMSLRVKELEEEEENSKEKKSHHRIGSKKDKWSVGEYCRAVYPEDRLVYEAQIIAIGDESCTVHFLGYNEDVEVDFDTLDESRGKHARRKQIRMSQDHYTPTSGDESACGEEPMNGNETQSSHCTKKKVTLHHGNHMRGHSVDYAAPENTFHSMCPVPNYCPAMPQPTAMMPPAPPMPQCPELAQNPSLCAMLTSWYMAGYYTGLHQGQRGQCQQRCCFRSSQNCCHH